MLGGSIHGIHHRFVTLSTLQVDCYLRSSLDLPERSIILYLKSTGLYLFNNSIFFFYFRVKYTINCTHPTLFMFNRQYISFWASQASGVKNSPANAGDIDDSGLMPGLGRSPGEGNGNLLHILGCKIPWTVACQATVHGSVSESDTTEQLSTHTFTI